MNIDNYEVDIRDGIIIVKRQDYYSPNISDVKEVKEVLESSTGKVYNYALYRSSLGYYNGYDYELNKRVPCGSLSLPRNIEKMKEYIKSKQE